MYIQLGIPKTGTFDLHKERTGLQNLMFHRLRNMALHYPHNSHLRYAGTAHILDRRNSHPRLLFGIRCILSIHTRNLSPCARSIRDIRNRCNKTKVRRFLALNGRP